MKKKTTALLLSVVLLLCATAGGTVAFMTDKDSAQNAFTVGDIKALLDEAETDDSGKALTGDQADRENENSYPVIPGYSVDKDPTVHVLKGSLPCYVFVCVADELNQVIAGSAEYTVESASWTQIGTKDEKTVYQYSTVVNAAAATQDLIVFDGLSFDETVITRQNISSLQGKTVTVSGYACQAIGVSADDAKAAALAYFGIS